MKVTNRVNAAVAGLNAFSTGANFVAFVGGHDPVNALFVFVGAATFVFFLAFVRNDSL